MRVRVSVLCLCAAGAPSAGAISPQEPAATPVQGLERVLWLDDRAELWMLCAEAAGPRVRVFDPWLRERAARPVAEMPPGGVDAGGDGSCELKLWANRRLRADVDGRLRILPLAWESAPQLHWGPGWATVELRCATPLSAVLWRRVGEAELQIAPFVADRFDGALQRARLQGFAAGERIEIALPERQPSFPPPVEPTWRAFVVPAVAPSGLRPSSAWPSE